MGYDREYLDDVTERLDRQAGRVEDAYDRVSFWDDVRDYAEQQGQNVRLDAGPMAWATW